MTPAARLSAAIIVLDDILGGAPAEVALTRWGRASRFAGSGDRHAVRDLVFDALRRKASAAALGGGMNGRGLILGLLRQRGDDPADLFTGLAHAPAAITLSDEGRLAQIHEALDCPEWLAPALQDSLGPDFVPVLRALQDRAPVYLRVNLRKGSRDQALALLAQDGVDAIFTPDTKTALQVTGNARKISASKAYVSGLVELQDLSSQALVAHLPMYDAVSILDFCAGGGGKALAMADRVTTQIRAYDINPRRMQDLPTRARRAGVSIGIITDPAAFAPYDLVLCDAPCSGSGSWRRDPQGKWALTPQKLEAVLEMQRQVLDDAAPLVKTGGVLAYATCSVLRAENQAQVAAFLHRHPRWRCTDSQVFLPLGGGDGFFLALLRIPKQD